MRDLKTSLDVLTAFAKTLDSARETKRYLSDREVLTNICSLAHALTIIFKEVLDLKSRVLKLEETKNEA